MIILKVLLLGHGVANDGCKRLLEEEKIEYDYLEIKDVLNTYDLIVKSPGISLFDSFFTNRKEEVISDIELAYRLRKPYIICVTGTNAKTTVSSMIYHVLKDEFKTVLCGNIGYSICDAVVDNKNTDIFVVEASSFQLESCLSFNPDVFVILNVNPHHLDHHKTLKHYVNSKLKYGISDDFNKYTIYSNDCVYLNNINKNNNRKLITFSNEKISSDIYKFNNYIYYQGEKIYRLKHKIHKYEISNYMAVLGVLISLKCNLKKCIKKLNNFKSIKYRMEKISKNIYNDAKSTNQYSTIAAISSLDNVLLICGGYDRGETLNISKDILSKIICVFAYGETKDIIKKYMDSKGVNCIIYNNLKDACLGVFPMLDKNKNLLYSPMYASYDQYKSYNERGYEFESLVKKSLLFKK